MEGSRALFAVAWMTLAAAAVPAVAAEHVPLPTAADNQVANVYPAQRIVRAGRPDVDVWVNKDEGGIYRPGESMRVYFRSTTDSYVLVFNVDTEGYIHLVYPYGPEDPPLVEGGREYRIPSRSDPYDLVADGPAGIEYVVAVASPFPFQNLPWYLSADRADGGRPDLEDQDGDETDSGQISGDPYVGIDRILRRIVPPGREDRVATNETYFYIDRRVDYPRYVCADCHYHPFYFDPYVNACSVFDIRVDATWAHYAPIRLGTVRPRYIYRVRPGAPSRYRQWKSQWSSLDGRATLRTRFLPERDIRNRRERPPQTRAVRPEFRDLRRYREGRIWRGRDEILRLRENRNRIIQPGGDRPSPPTNRGWWQQGERQPQPGRGQPPQADRGGRERATPPRQERGGANKGGGDRPKQADGSRDRGNSGDRQDRGNRDGQGRGR